MPTETKPLHLANSVSFSQITYRYRVIIYSGTDWGYPEQYECEVTTSDEAPDIWEHAEDAISEWVTTQERAVELYEFEIVPFFDHIRAQGTILDPNYNEDLEADGADLRPVEVYPLGFVHEIDFEDRR